MAYPRVADHGHNAHVHAARWSPEMGGCSEVGRGRILESRGRSVVAPTVVGRCVRGRRMTYRYPGKDRG